ncbi:hypothetical protein BDV98DRAFT_594881 [Pterulicium gracile]|uniref:Cytoplasmic tRNA 2-thiolation protein 2 n=1 Tax=Pterulicium gracile TaxID=1884261 RepID=A0A5C3QD02_9AGAR|nr:hypothetical protein BDV98DRAFT_594881 [Pterula gracilis]
MTCGNPNVDEQDALMPRRTIGKHANMCVKCKEPTGRVFIRHSVYCKDCFSIHVVQKCRRCLDPHINPTPSPSTSTSTNPKMKPTKTPKRTADLRASGNLVLGYSGGLGSAVLLEIIDKWYFKSISERDGGGDKGGKRHPRNLSKVWEKAYVCYVEMSGVDDTIRDTTEEIREAVSRYPMFEFVPLRLEDAFDPAWWARITGSATLPADLRIISPELDLSLPSSSSPSSSPTTNPLATLRTYLTSLPTTTALYTSLTHLTRLLLLHTARSLSASHLLLGTNLTGLSVNLIDGIAVGGGFVVREEAGEVWQPNADGKGQGRDGGEIRVVRPLRELGMKECAVWAWWEGVGVVGEESVPLKGASIGRLTKDFIIGLEKDYPSTVSAIARTCGKLAPKGSNGGKCVLCERPAQSGVQAWKDRISIREFDGIESVPHISTSTSASPLPTPSTPSPDSDPPLSLSPHLCYVCHTTLTSRSSRSTASSIAGGEGLVLPLWAREAMGRFVPAPLGDAGAAGGDETGAHRNGAGVNGDGAGVNGDGAGVNGDGAGVNGDGDEMKSHVNGDGEVLVRRKVGEDEMRERVGAFLL